LTVKTTYWTHKKCYKKLSILGIITEKLKTKINKKYLPGNQSSSITLTGVKLNLAFHSKANDTKGKKANKRMERNFIIVCFHLEK
jgi:hypothetical protein